MHSLINTRARRVRNYHTIKLLIHTYVYVCIPICPLHWLYKPFSAHRSVCQSVSQSINQPANSFYFINKNNFNWHRNLAKKTNFCLCALKLNKYLPCGKCGMRKVENAKWETWSENEIIKTKSESTILIYAASIVIYLPSPALPFYFSNWY